MLALYSNLTVHYFGIQRYVPAVHTSYTWDANGNLTSDGNQSYTYDQANRLVGVYATPGLRIWDAADKG